MLLKSNKIKKKKKKQEKKRKGSPDNCMRHSVVTRYLKGRRYCFFTNTVNMVGMKDNFASNYYNHVE